MKKINPKGKIPAKLYRRTLAAVNEMRRAEGVRALNRLPPGIPRSDCECPIGNALRPLGVILVDSAEITIRLVPKTVMGLSPIYVNTPMSVVVECPEVIANFIEAFDKLGDNEQLT